MSFLIHGDMVGMPGFWAIFLALDQTAGGGGRKYSFAGLLGQKIEFYLQFYRDRKLEFYSSLGSEKTRKTIYQKSHMIKNPMY